MFRKYARSLSRCISGKSFDSKSNARFKIPYNKIADLLVFTVFRMFHIAVLPGDGIGKEVY